MNRISGEKIVELGFLDARSKLIDVAAFLGVERYGGADDFRVQALKQAIRLLDLPDAERAQKILEALSDPTEEPIPAAHTQGAQGAWPGAEG